MANEYLMKEYELCFEQLRFYDARQESLLKYLCSLTSAVATAQFAVYQLLRGATTQFLGWEGILSGLVFIGTVLLYLAMLQNRLYFVFVARQLNAIRGYLMEFAADGFVKNQMYTSTNFPALKPLSVHTLQLIGAALISSLFAGASVYGLFAFLSCKLNILMAGQACLLVLAVEVSGGMLHLHFQGRKSADKAIHHAKDGDTNKKPEQSDRGK
ncbi:MAG: hypothetical protein WB341_06695 [Terracidiphilus sp.]